MERSCSNHRFQEETHCDRKRWITKSSYMHVSVNKISISMMCCQVNWLPTYHLCGPKMTKWRLLKASQRWRKRWRWLYLDATAPVQTQWFLHSCGPLTGLPTNTSLCVYSSIKGIFRVGIIQCEYYLPIPGRLQGRPLGLHEHILTLPK